MTLDEGTADPKPVPKGAELTPLDPDYAVPAVSAPPEFYASHGPMTDPREDASDRFLYWMI